MHYLVRSALFFLVAALAACGGGGGGGSESASTSISLSKTQLAFATEAYQRDKQTITVTYKGDGVVVGTPPGVALPAWLAVEEVSQSAGSVTFHIIVEYPGPVAPQDARLRFATGKADGSQVTYKDLNVSLVVSAPTELSAVAHHGQLPDAKMLSLGNGVNGSDFSVGVSYQSAQVGWLDVNASGTGFALAANTTQLPPGQYSAQLLFTSASGTELIRTVNYQVMAPALDNSPMAPLTINADSVAEDLSRSTTISANTSAINWTISAHSELLSAVANGNEIAVGINLEALTAAASGTYSEWVDISYTHPALTEAVIKRINLDVTVALPTIRVASPSVVYQNEAQKILLWGEHLDAVSSAALAAVLGPVGSFNRLNANEIELTVDPELLAGNYTIALADSLDLPRTPVQLTVRERPVFPVGEVDLPFPVSQVIYDAARTRFYIAESTYNEAIYQLALNGGAWTLTPFAISNAAGIGLTKDGSRLLVGTFDCSLWEVQLEQQLITQPNTPEYCGYNQYGAVNEFYNGLTVVADTDQWPGMWQYPSWQNVPFNVPSEHSPQVQFSEYGTHMIWAGGPTTSAQHTAYVYSAKTNEMKLWTTVGERYYTTELLNISANGNRLSHYNDIYNENLEYLGSLGDVTPYALNRVGLSPDGSRAAMYVRDSRTIRVFDISSDAGNFTDVGVAIPLDAAMDDTAKLIFSSDNQYLFVFATNRMTDTHKLYVFAL